MSSRSPEVPSAPEPLPEGPSPRWRRAAQGLRWMRLATYASLALLALAPVVGERATLASFIVPPLFGGICVLTYGAGLWRFGSVPSSTGAARPARQAFVCFASWWLVLLLPIVLIFTPTISRLSGRMLVNIALLWPFALVAIAGACWGLLARALGAALRAVGETPPAWTPKALGAWVAGCTLLIALAIWPFVGFAHRLVFALPLALVSAVVDFQRVSLGPAWWVALAGWCAFTLALASVMGRTAGALARRRERA